MAKKGAAKLRGRFPAGTKVRLVEVEGAHVLRPGPQHQTVDEQEVDKDGTLEFKSLDMEKRYFAVANVHGQPVEARLTPREDADGGALSGYEPLAMYDRVKLADGSFVDEPPDQNQKPDVDGATWLGQHQVPKGTLQRSDTPRGAAAIISADEVQRATRQWRKQEPTDQVVEETPDPGEQPARTSEPPDVTPAKAKQAARTTERAAKQAAKEAK